MKDGQWYEGDEIETFIDNFFLDSWSMNWRPELVRGVLQREGVEVTRIWESAPLHAKGPEPDVYTMVFYGEKRALVILADSEYGELNWASNSWAVIPIA